MLPITVRAHFKRGGKGFTTIELLIALLVASIGMLAAALMIFNIFRDFGISQEIKSLQEEVDLASLTVKAILEEADQLLITENGARISASYTDENNLLVWEKEFYAQNSALILADIKNNTSYAVIETLERIEFETLTNTVRVELALSRRGRLLENHFVVRPRN